MEEKIKKLVEQHSNNFTLGEEVRKLYWQEKQQTKSANTTTTTPDKNTIVDNTPTENRWTSNNTYLDTMTVEWSEAVKSMSK